MNQWIEDMKDFEKDVFLKIHPVTPTIPTDKKVRNLRMDLIEEEVNETLWALQENDMVEIADGIVDSIVVLIGTALTYGIDLEEIWNEVHKTNMAKGLGKINENGKKMKPEGWTPPDIKSLLVKQGWIDNDNID